MPVKKPTLTRNDQVNDTSTQNSKARKFPLVKEEKEKTVKRSGKRQRRMQEVEDIEKQPVFKKKHGETEKEFLLRVDQEADDRLAAAQRKLKTTSEKRKK